MDEQPDLIERGEWNCLIVLDACRFDYFEQVYENYLSGNLRKVRSPASNTYTWFEKIFNNSYLDTIYVAGNPHIRMIDGISEKFYKIVNAWNWGWDKNIGTVPPVEVSKGALVAHQLNPEKRLIVHYNQPHAPYLSLDISVQEPESSWVQKHIYRGVFQKLGGSKLLKMLGHRRVSRMAEVFGEKKPIHKIVDEVGEKRLKEAYKENLVEVLKSATSLISNLEGSIVVTSDHGEFLGEEDNYGHDPFLDDDELRNVPWLKVNTFIKK